LSLEKEEIIKFVSHSCLVSHSHKIGVFQEAIYYLIYEKFAVMYSVVIKDRERDVQVERMSMYILNEVETSHYLILVRLYFVWGRHCACEILIANPIDWLSAACLEYYILFSIDSSEDRKQYDEYCLSIF
jgi:hypothetical protein